MTGVRHAGGSGRTRALLISIAALAVTLLPSVAEACAVCFGNGEDDWTGGFVLGTIMMLALPPAIVAGAVLTIYRSIKRHDAEEAAAEAAAHTAEG